MKVPQVSIAKPKARVSVLEGKGMNLTHSIHGNGIFTYIYHTNQPNVGKYIPYMDAMGNISLEISLIFFQFICFGP